MKLYRKSRGVCGLLIAHYVIRFSYLYVKMSKDFVQEYIIVLIGFHSNSFFSLII